MKTQNKQDLRSLERTRAINIILEYEEELRDKLAATPGAKNYADVATVVHRLEKMRKDILGSMALYKKPIKRDAGNDFSAEEIDAAMALMAEENVFDGGA